MRNEEELDTNHGRRDGAVRAELREASCLRAIIMVPVFWDRVNGRGPWKRGFHGEPFRACVRLFDKRPEGVGRAGRVAIKHSCRGLLAKRHRVPGPTHNFSDTPPLGKRETLPHIPITISQ